MSEAQRDLVASNAKSLAEAHIPADVDDIDANELAASLIESTRIFDDLDRAPDAWFRGIYADETPVGFVMLSLDRDWAEYFLWRIMIDHRYQRYGYGEQALHQVIDYVRTLPEARALLTSHVRGNQVAAGFFGKYGFHYTGDEMSMSDLVMKLDLTDAPSRTATKSRPTSDDSESGR